MEAVQLMGGQRLHRRVPGRAAGPGRQGLPDLRRHRRDPGDPHRQGPAPPFVVRSRAASGRDPEAAPEPQETAMAHDFAADRRIDPRIKRSSSSCRISSRRRRPPGRSCSPRPTPPRHSRGPRRSPVHGLVRHRGGCPVGRAPHLHGVDHVVPDGNIINLQIIGPRATRWCPASITSTAGA